MDGEVLEEISNSAAVSCGREDWAVGFTPEK